MAAWSAAAAMLLPCLARAHHFMDDRLPGTFADGFLSGLGHPIIGLDHFAFIVAAGFFLALFPRGAFGVLALAAGSLLGAALHLGGLDLPGGEAAVALSVVLVGALLVARRTVPEPWLLGGLALAGGLHGHAYAETIFGAEPMPLVAYLAGFSVIQLCIASAALLLHRRLLAAHSRASMPLAAAMGTAAAAIGVVFVALRLSL